MKNISRQMYLLFHGRFPSEKAAALFVAKNAEAFTTQGFVVTLVVPRVRKKRMALTQAAESFSLPKGVTVVRLPVVDLFRLPFLSPIAFFCSYLTFSFSLLGYFFLKAKKDAVWYGNEHLPLFVLSFFGARVFYEMHDFPEKSIFFYRLFFKRVWGAVITNSWKAQKATTVLGLDSKRILVEQNAVDLEDFSFSMSQVEAREKLKIPKEGIIVLYTGHLYGWKGVDTLAQAARKLPEAQFIFVGGRAWDDVPNFQARYRDVSNIVVTGHRPYQEIPLWQKAADILALPNSGKEDISRFYTSPMKLFGYMASGRPVIASDLPSIREVASNRAVYFVPSDDPDALKEGIEKILIDTLLQKNLAREALKEVQEHTWSKRAVRISSFIERCLMVR